MTRLNAILLQELALFLLVNLLLLSPIVVSSQSILEVTADISSQPHTFQIYGVTSPGYISAIEMDSDGLQEDTIEIRMYFKHCSPNSSLQYFDTIVTVESVPPYNLLILTYRDSNTVILGPQPCYLYYPDILPVDTFYLSAEQILSTEERDRIPEIKVYPNPVTDYLRLPASLLWEQATVYTLTGQKVIQVYAKDQLDYILVGHLPFGLYMLVLQRIDGAILGSAKFVRSL